MELGDYLNNSRKEYDLDSLDELKIDENPFNQFSRWMDHAIASQILEPNAMTLSTVSADHRPSSRVVLLRAFDESGFIFYTNYNSRKGADLSENPNASINFFWPDLHRQVRIEGTISKVPNETSDRYFSSRPRESRIGAWVSDQSGLLSSRKVLEDKFLEFTNKFSDVDIARPPHWGGYLISPVFFEFWQGRPSRLHDRIVYRSSNNGVWQRSRLYP
ncbi:MAG: pyridoxamine 5-phosphate oxidase [Bacteroidota bacterium]|jgi:pyridoxamine 5'-phosphate oxidase